MSLLFEAMEKCTMLTKVSGSDGYGATVDVWTDGAAFLGAITFDSSAEAKRAEAAGVTDLYTITTNRAILLNYHDVFRRERDGALFRVTSDGADKITPRSAALDMRQVSAERWEAQNG